ncbi:MAG: Ig family protein, partial [Candidatus Solibacter sp.]|nr:Ig family protein [Candidatus Solibacter sp.]
VAYSSSAVATGGTGSYLYSIVGALPAGLSINASTGLISGTPTVYGHFSFTVKVTDANNNTATAGSTSCTLNIVSPALSVICAPITTGQQGVAYSSKVVASGGTGSYTYSIVGGALPTGITLNATTGVISGTPTVFGTFSYKIQAKDSNGAIATTGATSCTLTIMPVPPYLQCGTCSSNKATVGVAYSAKLTVTGGTGTGYVFTLDAGSALPLGLSLNAGTGVISGIPTTPGTYIVTTVVTDSMGGTDTATCTIIVSGPPLNLDCGTCGSNRATLGTPYTSALTATGGKPGYTYSISSGSLPSGVTLSATTGVISGTPTASGTYTFTSKVVDANGIVDTARCTIYVAPSPINLDCGSCGSIHLSVGVAYSSKLTVTGGRAVYTYSIVSGSLPTGLTLNPTTGAITGTPTAIGSFTFTSKVVDADGFTDTATCTITVAGSPVNLECGICGNSTVKAGTAYSATFAITGGKAPYVYTVTTGSLPPGLTLNAGTGAITGTPTTPGTYTFTTTVKDANGSTDTATCTIYVTGSAINLDCGACKSGKAILGAPYSNTLSVTGASGSVTFSIVGGALPTGLRLNTTTGAISGTPTVSGTYTFTSQVKDSLGRTDTDICTITVAAVPLDIQCGSCSVGNGTVGSPYSATFQVTGGVAGYTFSLTAGSLPAGLTLNAGTGVISGTPTTAGTYTFTAKVTDSKGTTDTITCTIAIVAVPLDIQCGTCGSNRVYVGQSYSVQLAASGGSAPYIYSIYAGSLPAGLTLNAATGVISGSPTTPGTYTFTSKVTDSKGKTDIATCTITVAASPVNLDCGTCGSSKAQLGVFYSSTLKPTGGIGSYTFAITAGSLPAGLTLNPTTGVISGTPTADGTFTFTSKATDSKGSSDIAECTIVVTGIIKCGDFVTYTQGGWGATPNGGNPGTLLKNSFYKVYGSAGISIGGSYKLTFNAASAITGFLPQGGTPGVLTGSAINPTTSNAGVFAGQVLALQLSVDFSNKGITPGGLAGLKLNGGPLAGQTIAQVLALANAVLGGNTSALPTGLTVSGLNEIVNSLNNNFDGGNTNGGYLH